MFHVFIDTLYRSSFKFTVLKSWQMQLENASEVGYKFRWKTKSKF